MRHEAWVNLGANVLVFECTHASCPMPHDRFMTFPALFRLTLTTRSVPVDEDPHPTRPGLVRSLDPSAQRDRAVVSNRPFRLRLVLPRRLTSLLTR